MKRIHKFPILKGLSVIGAVSCSLTVQAHKSPNVIFVLADEWRGQDLGYAGNRDVITPNLDKLAGESLNLTNAISCCPVSCPYRGSLLTGQYPLSNGVFMNDVLLDTGSLTISKSFRAAGYKTAYIGKWHLDGHGRSSFIPRERRQGFEYWKVLECTHDYNNSWYWDNDDQKKKWETYDAYAQTADAVEYIKDNCRGNQPFFMILSWGPPHTPFQTAPERCKQLYHNKNLNIRGNVPIELYDKTVEDLIGYYGHITALDSCIGALQEAIKKSGIEENTIFIFTSDHGAMVNSHGFQHKQRPYEEAVNVPFLIKYPAALGNTGKQSAMLLNTPDIMPTLLSMCKLRVPHSIEGNDKSKIILGKAGDNTDAVLIACYQPFGQWSKKTGGREYRGVRTKQYTYVRDLNGPWLLYDNQKDVYQLNNLVDVPEYSGIRKDLEQKLKKLLRKSNDDFRPGMEYVKKWNYIVDDTETIPYSKVNYQGLPIRE